MILNSIVWGHSLLAVGSKTYYIYISHYYFHFRTHSDIFRTLDCVNSSQLTAYLDRLLFVYVYIYIRYIYIYTHVFLLSLFVPAKELPACHAGGGPHGYSDLADQKRGCGVVVFGRGGIDGHSACTSSFHPKQLEI